MMKIPAIDENKISHARLDALEEAQQIAVALIQQIYGSYCEAVLTVRFNDGHGFSAATRNAGKADLLEFALDPPAEYVCL
jgi:hypothetical protein